MDRVRNLLPGASAVALSALLLLGLASPKTVQAGALFEGYWLLIESVRNCFVPSNCNGTSGELRFVEPGANDVFLFGGRAVASVSDTHLHIEFNDQVVFADEWPRFNGVQLRSASAGMPAITSVELLRSGDALFTAQVDDRVAFDPTRAWFDFGGLHLGTGDSFEFVFNSPVPEPGPAALLAVGLCALLAVTKLRASRLGRVAPGAPC